MAAVMQFFKKLSDPGLSDEHPSSRHTEKDPEQAPEDVPEALAWRKISDAEKPEACAWRKISDAETPEASAWRKISNAETPEASAWRRDSYAEYDADQLPLIKEMLSRCWRYRKSAEGSRISSTRAQGCWVHCQTAQRSRIWEAALAYWIWSKGTPRNWI